MGSAIRGALTVIATGGTVMLRGSSTRREWRVTVALVTGSAGLIGSEAARHFAGLGLDVVGIDNDMRRYFFGEDGSTAWSLREPDERPRRPRTRTTTSTSATAPGSSRSSRSTAPTSPW